MNKESAKLNPTLEVLDKHINQRKKQKTTEMNKESRKLNPTLESFRQTY